MSGRMPQDLQKLLSQVDDPEKISEIQKQWSEYSAANTAYERNYEFQFANLTEGNLKFKQDKKIPTPAEQMRDYNDRIREQINQALDEKEQVYELREVDEANVEESSKDKLMRQFKLTFDNRTNQDKDITDTKDVNKSNELDKSQERSLTFMKEHNLEQEEKRSNKIKEDPVQDQKNSYDFKLVFGSIDKSIDDVELEKDEYQKEDLDMEID